MGKIENIVNVKNETLLECRKFLLYISSCSEKLLQEINTEEKEFYIEKKDTLLPKDVLSGIHIVHKKMSKRTV